MNNRWDPRSLTAGQEQGGTSEDGPYSYKNWGAMERQQ